MSSVVKFDKPLDDLHVLGERLQQSIALTRARLPAIKLPRTKVRVLRSLDHAEYMFIMLSNTVQTVERMTGFLEKGLGLNMNALFALAGGNEKAARVTTHSAMVMVNEGIRHTLSELSRMNELLDKEKENVKQ